MKRLLLLSLVLCIGMAGYSQNEAIIVKNSRAFDAMPINAMDNATDDATNFQNPVSMIRGTANLGPSETQIGTTVYDLFSNYNVGDRFYRFEDGTMAAVFIFGTEASNFPERGTGYNYYDGTAWGPAPTERVENTRTGWPNIAAHGAGGEVGVAHNGSAGLEIIMRDTKGTGDWTQTNFLGPPGLEDDITWPRMITSGENNEVIHMIAGTGAEYLGQDPINVYSRSTDGGATWDPQNVVIDGMGADYYFNNVQDQSVFVADGNTVALLNVSMWHDLYYVRSDDNGDTWTTTVVWEHPVPFMDPDVDLVDTFFCPDYSGHMAFDAEGHAHVVFGITRGLANEESGAVSFPYHPEWEGVGYWNDMMEPFSNDLNALAPPKAGYETELVNDETYIGWLQDVDGNGVIELEGILPIRTYSSNTTPNITIDEYGQRFVIWAGNTEGYVYTGGTEASNYKHIWGRAYANGAWGPFKDLTEDIAHIFDDCVYPMIASTSDGNIHYIYQTDIAPGNALDSDHDYHDNFWIYAMLPKDDLLTGISEQEVIDDSHVSQNFPNPFNGTTTVNVNLEQAAELSLVVTNLTGQKVLEINKGQVAAQTHSFTIDASNLQSGIYFYTVTAGKSQVTRKMIVE